MSELLSNPSPSDPQTRITKLENKLKNAQQEIVTLSQIILSRKLARSNTDLTRSFDQTPQVDARTLESMFKVMTMSLHLTRVPLVMRFGYFKRRHQRRLVRALKDHRLIDTNWYRATYPEVAKSGLDPAMYFVTHGIKAGHVPHPKFAAKMPR